MTIRDSVAVNCSAPWRGGFVHSHDMDSSLAVVNTTVTGCSAEVGGTIRCYSRMTVMAMGRLMTLLMPLAHPLVLICILVSLSPCRLRVFARLGALHFERGSVIGSSFVDCRATEVRFMQFAFRAATPFHAHKIR